MPRRRFASAELMRLGLALGALAFLDGDAGGQPDATIRAGNETIRRKLETPIPLRVKELPLGDVFRYVRESTAEAGDAGVPIDVDPGSLERAQVPITTPVTYESRDGEPLKDSLATVLGRLGLRSRVEDGSLRISWTRYRLLDRDPETKRIWDRLEEKFDLAFEKTPLEDVLKQIKDVTGKGANGKGLPIYVDPVGLQETEKSLATPISFTAKGETLKSSLERMLGSIDLTYAVKDGLLTITSRTSGDPEPVGGP